MRARSPQVTSVEAFLISAGLVAIAEIGDKTQLLAMLLATRYRKPVPIILGTLAAVFAWRPREGPPQAWFEPRRVAIASAGIVLVVCYAGTYFVFRNYALSLDEFLVGFDAAILHHGALLARIPVEWRAYLDSLQPLFVLHAPGDIAWSSAYLPGNAAIRAVFERLGDGALAPPVLAAASISSSRCGSGPKFGAITLCTSTREAPPFVSCAARRWVPSMSGNGTGAVSGPETGTSDSIATVVSLARNRSCR